MSRSSLSHKNQNRTYVYINYTTWRVLGINDMDPPSAKTNKYISKRTSIILRKTSLWELYKYKK